MNPKSEIEVFTDLPRRQALPDGPVMTIGSTKSIVYFNKEASEILRSVKATHLKFGVDWRAAKPLAMLCGPSDPGAIALGFHPSAKGPGTYQLPKEALAFFEKFRAVTGETQRFPLEWRDDVKGFQFEMTQVQSAADQRRKNKPGPARRKKAS